MRGGRILVTGGAGYIGSHTVHLLLRQGYEVTVVDNLSRGHAHNVDPQRLRRVDISDGEALRRILSGADYRAVIHFAAYISVGESTAKPELYFGNNVGGTLTLLSAMAESGVRRLVFSSTAAVYGNPERVPIEEDQPFAPVNPYGESKVTVERVLRWLDQYSGLRSVALRYFNACGADVEAGLGEEHEPETHLIPLMLRAVATGKPVTLFGDDYATPDGTCIRDYIHVADLAQAHVAALEHLLEDGKSAAFNVGTGAGLSVKEVLRAVEEVTGTSVPHIAGPRRAGDPAVLVANSDKLKRTLGWTPQHSDIHEIVRSAWQFQQSRMGRK